MTEIRNRLLINASPFETRIAVTRAGRLERVLVEADEERSVVGNIYLGKVNRVLPGMNAAFVDMGLERAGFMHGKDLEPEPDGDLEIKQTGQERSTANLPIDKRIKAGDTLLVQVVKPPKGTKGARVKGVLTIPGRNLVLVPGRKWVGISRRIRQPQERDRLHALISQSERDDVGYIVRTAAEAKPDDEILADVNYVNRLWDAINQKQTVQSAPSVVYTEPDLMHKALRDLLQVDIDEIVIDDEDAFEQLRKYIQAVMPGRVADFRLHAEEQTLFEHYGVEKDLQAAMSRRVDMPSKGYLIIDETEALTAIDVNTGSFVGSRNQEDTIIATNREAVDAVAHQIRLRNLGGLIVVDFIDMLRQEHREEIFQRFTEAVKADPARISVTKVSELGLVELTRQRTGATLQGALTESCSACNGTGRQRRGRTLLGQLYRKIAHACKAFPSQSIEVKLHPDLGEAVWATEMDWLRELETIYGARIRLIFESRNAREEFTVTPAEPLT